MVLVELQPCLVVMLWPAADGVSAVSCGVTRPVLRDADGCDCRVPVAHVRDPLTRMPAPRCSPWRPVVHYRGHQHDAALGCPCPQRSTGLTCSAMQAGLEPAPWLAFEGRWGSSVVAPALQDWFYRAENPVTRTWLEQVGWMTPGRIECAAPDTAPAVPDPPEPTQPAYQGSARSCAAAARTLLGLRHRCSPK